MKGPRSLVDEMLDGHGTRIVGAICAYELLALHPDCPLPTISEVVEEHPVIGIGLIAALAYHWWGQRKGGGSTC